MDTSQILAAVQSQKIITFTYGGYARRCEPHVLGIANGVEQVLCYQLSGGSKRGRLPQWRRFETGNIMDLKLTDEEFSGKRPVPHPHSLGWDRIDAVVE